MHDIIYHSLHQCEDSLSSLVWRHWSLLAPIFKYIYFSKVYTMLFIHFYQKRTNIMFHNSLRFEIRAESFSQNLVLQYDIPTILINIYLLALWNRLTIIFYMHNNISPYVLSEDSPAQQGTVNQWRVEFGESGGAVSGRRPAKSGVPGRRVRLCPLGVCHERGRIPFGHARRDRGLRRLPGE